MSNDEVVEELGDRIRLEDGAVAWPAQLVRRCACARLRDRLSRGLGGVDVADSPRGASRVAGCAVDRRQREPVRVGRPLRRAQAGGRGDRQLERAAREVSVEAVSLPTRRSQAAPQAAPGRRLRVRPSPRRSPRIGELARAAQAGTSPGRGSRSRRRRLRGGRAPRGPRRRCGSSWRRRPAVPDRAAAGRRRCRRASAGGSRAGVAREARSARSLTTDLSLAVGHERRARAPRAPAASVSSHFTPTWTFRKRAGDAPWETCACWPGWPLPQFVRPCIVHSSGPATRSSEPQKTGVIPV